MAVTRRGTLVAGVVTTVTVDTNGGDISIYNLDVSSDFTVINARVGPPPPYVLTDPGSPGVDGDLAVPGITVVANPSGARQLQVKLICSTAVDFAVQAINYLGR